MDNKLNFELSNKLNFELLDKHARRWQQKDSIGMFFDYYWEFTENEIETQLFGCTRHGFVVWQTPPPPAFYQTYKHYHPNGYLKLRGRRMGRATKIGVWEYFDELGLLLKTVDEDAKFGKFSYNELLLFLHQQGYINLETGENREGISLGYNVEAKQWGVFVRVGAWLTRYVIDGETGEVLGKEGPSPIIR